jgi:hypothetical protein
MSQALPSFIRPNSLISFFACPVVCFILIILFLILARPLLIPDVNVEYIGKTEVTWSTGDILVLSEKVFSTFPKVITTQWYHVCVIFVENNLPFVMDMGCVYTLDKWMGFYRGRGATILRVPLVTSSGVPDESAMIHYLESSKFPRGLLEFAHTFGRIVTQGRQFFPRPIGTISDKPQTRIQYCTEFALGVCQAGGILMPGQPVELDNRMVVWQALPMNTGYRYDRPHLL